MHLFAGKVNTKTKEGAENKENPYIVRVPLNEEASGTVADFTKGLRLSQIFGCFEMENLVTTYKRPKDCFSEVYCIIILYLQPFQILKWGKVYGGHI